MQEPHPDDDIVVYHSTSPENAAHLQKHGTTGAKVRGEGWMSKATGQQYDYEPGRGLGEGLYVTRHPGEGNLYGTHSLPVRIKMRDLGVSPEMEGSTPWRALNRREGYIPHVLQPHQFGDTYTDADHRHWENQHG